ncbi:hypothetical protein C8F01DRAFT_1149868 [Mycena amicta]|nr:hypothetical protein C8F01DRAFT_1149868 [Mycena amicta]
MLVGLLAPELIAGFAARQLLMARTFSKKYNISLTHGFFICMGGFVDGQGHPIVTYAQINQPDVLPAIQGTSKASIEDKSKGDALSKGITFFQGLWFVLQCITRTAQHLPLTELEAATLAFAAVNVFTWLLWWGKPLDIRDPIVVACEVALEESENESPLQQKRDWWTKFLGLLGNAYDSKEYNPLCNNAVPTFWYSSAEDDPNASEGQTGWSLVGQFLVAAIFGAIHCIAWYTVFASTAEMWLWRISAVLIAGLPLITAFLLVSTDHVPLFFEYFYGGFFGVSVVLYPILRIILLILPFTALRTLPPATFVDVNWSVHSTLVASTYVSVRILPPKKLRERSLVL